MSGFGAKAYSKVGMDTDLITADPHKLTLMLFDGAIHCIERAKVFLAERRIAQKCDALSQACNIVDGGLRVSVDPSHDPAFAARLVSLYQYVLMRLLQGNLRNDVAALDEARRILGELRGAWVRIAPSAAHGPTAQDLPTPVGQAAPPAAVRAVVRKELAAYRA